MINYRSVVRRGLTLILGLSIGACNSDSADSVVNLEITSPTSLSAIDTTDSSMSLSGTADSGAGISSVSWANDRGGEGIADGTDSWQATGIALELGENTVTIVAEDTDGEITSKSIRIKRESGENGSVTLSWEPPTARVDGTPLTNLAGYKILYGRMSGTYDYEIAIDNPGISAYVVENLVSGDWFFALAAYDSEGLESERSNEVLREIS
jgi:hypothetical protein